jgi:hypothetical protein
LARSSFRPATPADAPALRELLSEAGLHPNSEPAALEWKYWHERTDWPGPRSFVMARGDQILAHAAIIPGACLSGTHRVRTIHLIDWAARPSATGAGVSLMKYLGQTTDALLAVGGGAQTLQLLPHLGFRLCGEATSYVRPLHPLRILAPSVHPMRTLLPRVARSALWSLRSPTLDVSGWTVRRVAGGGISEVPLALPAATNGLAVFERREGLFEYFLKCPIAPMEFYVLEKEGRVRGYFLLAFALRQARLADCWMDSADPGDWRALIQCAVRQAKQHPLAAELAAWGSDATLSRCLRECGFHARGTASVQVCAPRHPTLAATPLRVQMLDNDTAYRHRGRNEFWA